MQLMPEALVRAAIAEHVLGTPAASGRLGSIELHPHQREGVTRARRILAQHRGALIADDVGLGKTFVALAVAGGYRAPLVVTPAALQGAWADASARAGVPVRLTSIERLSRGAAPPVAHDLVVIDEAHNFRNPATRRFAVVRQVCMSVPVLLLSATPVQNRVADLRVVMSLFLGERALAASLDELSQMIVRRTEADLPQLASGLPSIEAPAWLACAEDVDCLDAILSLPPPVAAGDAEAGGALVAWTLVRQWASSRAALRGALRRRLARAHALVDVLLEGRMPTRAALSAWCYADGAQQLAFPFMAGNSPMPGPAALLDQVRRHATGVSDLLQSLTHSPDPDVARASALSTLAREHAPRRIVAFSEYAATVEALYRLLMPAARVAVLTHAGGRVVGGRLSRRDVLARFLPGSRVAERERIDLLLTTDVLSEGVNLHDASIVVHLDLPWNPARLAQRVGRVRRLGSPASSVSVFALAPPAPAERMLELRRRLTAKLEAAGSSVGPVGDVLPDVRVDGAPGATALQQRIAATLERWRSPGASERCAAWAAVRASIPGTIACIRRDRQTVLVVEHDGFSTDANDVERLLSAITSGVATAPMGEPDHTIARLTSWLSHRGTTDVIDLAERRAARSRRALLRRLDAIGDQAPRHTRAALAPMLRSARSVATAALSAGAEGVLDELARAEMSDAAWLQAIAQFAALNVPAQRNDAPEILALLLLRPD